MSQKAKKILITGGAGFIGSNFIHYLLKKDPRLEIINYDKLTYAGNLWNLKDIENNSNYHFIKGDICDKNNLESAFKEYSPEYVVNFAAESHVDRSIQNPEEFIKTNVLGVQNLLNISHENSVQKFIQISTDEVYGSLGNSGFFTEKNHLEPNSPYSASKASADLLARAYYKTYSFPAIVTRCSNNYGPYQFPEKLIPLIISNCLYGKKIPVYGDGLNIRDWLYVGDHCSAIDAVMQKGEIGETYNVGGNNEKTNIEIVKTIISILSEKLPKSSISEALISFVEDRKGHDRRYAIDSSKIREELGWKPSMSFEEGIRKTVEWYLNNQKWLNSILTGDYITYYKRVYGHKAEGK
ncbi:dTDP-glucose 4,6-dehydratase [Methanosarcina sp. WWM596]|uniref:dTDP-glucose 4,6-dehydratase n=1 Tax=Methanosarcina sp. WWM596 TaxID=1434103 RepID=UPI0006154B41|nr:dTDP-glucose 4,6-dehydratase [Methanosarcina sp. WWM596]AKB18855.1 dTDP-glucose 4,6-dehydratase [Methanosarcina sp. WWM596]